MDSKHELNIDNRDKKIISSLELDSRASLASIGAKAGLSKAAVAARIAAIRKSGLIDRFLVPLNYAALGKTTYRLYMKFENTPAGFEQELADYLFMHGAVRWFTFTQGEWDVVMRFLCQDVAEFRSAEREVMARFGRYVKSRVFSIGLVSPTHLCTYFTGNEGSYLAKMQAYNKGAARLSKTEYKILFWLYEDSRMSVSEIAKRVGISPDSVSYHLKKLEQKQAFFAYSLRINRTKIGYTETKVILWLQHTTPKRIQELLKYCDAHPNVSFFCEILGPWDMEIDLDVKDPKEMYRIMRVMRTEFSDVIRDFTVLTKIKEFEANPLAKFAGYGIPKSAVPRFDE